MAYTISAPPRPNISLPPRPNIGGPGQVKPPKPFNPIAPPKKPAKVPGGVTSTYGAPHPLAQQLGQHSSTPGPPAPHGPAAPAAPSAAPAAPPQSPPFDSTYYANVAANQFKVGNQVNALNLQGTQNDTALQTALGQLAYQQPRDSLRLEEAANRRGALYSTAYDQSQADLGHQYLGKQFGAQTAHDTTRDKLATQIAALQQGVPIYNNQQEADSASRLAAAAARDPTLGQSTGGLDTQPGHVTGAAQTGINNIAAKATVNSATKPPNPITGGHYVQIAPGKFQLIHAIGPGKWAPGPPLAKAIGKKGKK